MPKQEIKITSVLYRDRFTRYVTFVQNGHTKRVVRRLYSPTMQGGYVNFAGRRVSAKVRVG